MILWGFRVSHPQMSLCGLPSSSTPGTTSGRGLAHTKRLAKVPLIDLPGAQGKLLIPEHPLFLPSCSDPLAPMCLTPSLAQNVLYTHVPYLPPNLLCL